MKDIITLLEQAKDCQFRVSTRQTESYELYFVHEKTETVRATSYTTRSVTVYTDHDGFKGDYTFNISPSDTEEQLIKKIADAKERSLLICNEMYSLPAAEQENSEIPSNFSGRSLQELAAAIADACFGADMPEGGSINALEVFVYRETVTVQNSNGLNKSEHKYRAMVEAIPTWTEDGQSVELYEAMNFTNLDEAEITAEITEKLREVRDRYHAKKPNEQLSVPVLLRTPEIAQLAGELVRPLNYSSIYSKTNLYGKGDDVQQRTDGDAITIECKAGVPGSRFSALFDSDGSALRDRVVIEGGVAKSAYGNNRFAQYLKEECTGELPCIEMTAGTLTDDELRGMTYLECASLSGLQVDLYNDYIGGEVRLAYLVKDGVKTPLTGISISGKLSEVLPTLRLSDSRRTHDNFFGPDRALLQKMTIL